MIIARSNGLYAGDTGHKTGGFKESDAPSATKLARIITTPAINSAII